MGCLCCATVMIFHSHATNLHEESVRTGYYSLHSSISFGLIVDHSMLRLIKEIRTMTGQCLFAEINGRKVVANMHARNSNWQLRMTKQDSARKGKDGVLKNLIHTLKKIL